MKEDVIVVDIFQHVIDSFQRVTKPTYTYGRQIDILTFLQNKSDSISLGDTSYPLFALFQDFPVDRSGGYYGVATIPKIIIACLTTSTDDPPTRYTKTFKPILYPIYYEFLRCLARSKYIVEGDPDFIPHVQWDRPGKMPVSGSNSFIDAIEIQNLKITISQIKTC